MELIILSGRSGAGISTVSRILEDEGYYHLDNLMLPMLLPVVQDLARRNLYERVVIGLSSISLSNLSEPSSLHTILQLLESHVVNLRIWYVDAHEDILVNRYNESRRPHPFSIQQGLGLNAAMHKEYEALSLYKNAANQTINTDHSDITQVRNFVLKYLATKEDHKLHLHLFSFGFKYGMPNKVDFMYDVRCLPNPYWEEHLKTKTGLDESVCKYFQQKPIVNEMVSSIVDFFEHWLPEFLKQDRTYIDIGIGCTGGQHRSVYITERVYQSLNKKTNYALMTIAHREKSKWLPH